MQIRTDGKFAYREEFVDDIADLLDENTNNSLKCITME